MPNPPCKIWCSVSNQWLTRRILSVILEVAFGSKNLTQIFSTGKIFGFREELGWNLQIISWTGPGKISPSAALSTMCSTTVITGTKMNMSSTSCFTGGRNSAAAAKISTSRWMTSFWCRPASATLPWAHRWIPLPLCCIFPCRLSSRCSKRAASMISRRNHPGRAPLPPPAVLCQPDLSVCPAGRALRPAGGQSQSGAAAPYPLHRVLPYPAQYHARG